jgi:hypothetical protein
MGISMYVASRKSLLEAWMQTKSYRILQIRSIILAHACEERGVEFQENHPYRMPDTDDKVHFLP